ncbi:MAG TPA: FAD binding domain-containing protein [Haliangiales bacterium]|nr:FAD binding domain-containing protein [Haliangiales bacterium]
MRPFLAEYELVPGGSFDAVLALLGEGDFRPLAGGTDVMVMLAAGKLSHRRWVNVWGVPELRGLEVTPEAVTLGALTTYTEIRRSEVLRREFPMLVQAAAETGGWAIQNRGTVGGNIANASPAADSPPALLAYGATIELRSRAGARWVDYAAYHTGYKQTILAPGEIVARVRLPRAQGERVHYYRKVGPRRAQAISKVCFAGCADLAGGRVAAARIALGGVAPIVARCPAAEAAVVAGDPGAVLGADIAPIDDVRSSARYRRRIAENLLGEFRRAIAERAAP